MTGPQVVSDKLNIFLSILSNVGLVLSNGALGLGDTGRVVALLGYAGNLVRDIASGVSQMKEIDALVKKMVEEERGPTDGEWSALENRVAIASAGFAAVRATL